MIGKLSHTFRGNSAAKRSSRASGCRKVKSLRLSTKQAEEESRDIAAGGMDRHAASLLCLVTRLIIDPDCQHIWLSGVSGTQESVAKKGCS